MTKPATKKSLTSEDALNEVASQMKAKLDLTEEEVRESAFCANRSNVNDSNHIYTDQEACTES